MDISLDGRADDGESGERDDVGADVEQVIGGANGDTLTGSPAANVLDGRAGDDTIDGRAGDDQLIGGDNTPGNDSLTGGDGRDDVRGGPGDDALDGGDGDDVLSGAGGGDELDAGAGDDVAAGGAGVDALGGGAGDDILFGGEEALIGGDGGDSLSGGPGADVLRAGRGNDRLDGGAGPDLLSGEAGTDTVTYEDRTNPVSVTFNGLPDDGERDEHDNVADDIEIVLGGREGDTLTGKAGEDTEDGGPGEDLVDGGPQADRLTGGDEPDLIRARDGSPDVVLCGDGGDLALVDRQDTVRECETVDTGGRRRLVRGETALVRPEPAGFELRLPGGTRFFDMRETVKVPLRSTIDATAGPVQLSTARTRSGARQRAIAQQGVFTLRQTSGARPRTRLLLRGTFSRTCRAAAAGRAAGRQDKRRRVRLQIGKPRGRWEVHGAYSSSAAEGTAWVTEDRCDGTHTTVLEGAVRVHDFGRNRNVVVRAGSEYVARPSRRRGG